MKLTNSFVNRQQQNKSCYFTNQFFLPTLFPPPYYPLYILQYTFFISNQIYFLVETILVGMLECLTDELTFFFN